MFIRGLVILRTVTPKTLICHTTFVGFSKTALVNDLNFFPLSLIEFCFETEFTCYNRQTRGKSHLRRIDWSTLSANNFSKRFPL